MEEALKYQGPVARLEERQNNQERHYDEIMVGCPFDLPVLRLDGMLQRLRPYPTSHVFVPRLGQDSNATTYYLFACRPHCVIWRRAALCTSRCVCLWMGLVTLAGLWLQSTSTRGIAMCLQPHRCRRCTQHVSCILARSCRACMPRWPCLALLQAQSKRLDVVDHKLDRLEAGSSVYQQVRVLVVGFGHNVRFAVDDHLYVRIASTNRTFVTAACSMLVHRLAQ